MALHVDNLAIDIFCYNVAKQICAYLAALGKIDIISFSGGIGEASEVIRNKICSYLPFRFKMEIINTNEEELMIQKALQLIKGK